jgi:hypothetical protein
MATLGTTIHRADIFGVGFQLTVGGKSYKLLVSVNYNWNVDGGCKV